MKTLRLPNGPERALVCKGLLFIVIILIVALAVLYLVVFAVVRIMTHGIPLLSPETRLAVVCRVALSTGAVFFLALAALALAIGRMVARYVRERGRLLAEREMRLAADIQASAMPRVFPAFPELKEFDVFAMMRPAREVGGDFYDFFFSRPRRLLFLVADVSGKGVPAALFMMRAKSLLKGLVLSGVPLPEAVRRTNEGLCEGNDATVFVTAWIGELNIDTGVVTYVNAGHNRPILRRRGGDGTDYVRDQPCLFLGAMTGVEYVSHKLSLAPGDSLYLYTDGITEQVNAKFELFGEDRLLHAVKHTPLRQRPLLERVAHAVAHHRGTAEQTDDCTQFEVVWRGRPVGVRHDYAPTMAGLAQASADLEKALEGVDFGPKMELLTAADEVFMNIIGHAGATRWSIEIERCSFPDEVRLVFTDDGRPFDPLKVEAPDTSIAIEERAVGGLGIFIVRKTMSPVTYVYRDGHNVLTLGKSLEPGAEPAAAPDEPAGAAKIPLAARIIRRSRRK